MIFEIEEIPDGGLDFNLLAEKEQFEINQPDCSLSDNVRVNGKLTRIEQDILFFWPITGLASGRLYKMFKTVFFRGKE